ncbi:hypothetical protein EU527_01940 [Candidatus Thorarchaeota archaeon]|nr:MAG: hypothetical protein EU527_01940 [Candidatus Thorarchaeota archaeon]
MSDLLPDSVRRQVLDKITPSQKEVETQREIINKLTNALHNRADSAGFTYSFIEAQGSTGEKQTQLSGATDIDLFVALSTEDHSDILELPLTNRHKAIDDLMTKLVSEWFEPALRGVEVHEVQRAFSQHPFLSLKIQGIDIDILGCFDIDTERLARDGPITAVDRTVHHTKYIAQRLTDKKREDVRILKSFVRACHAYGDTCAVGRMGLTGVALELLVVFNTSLEKAMKALRHLDTKPVDTVNRTLKDLKRIKTFYDDHIFLIDPTDTNRNIASSFTPRAYRWVQYRIDRLYEILTEHDDAIIEQLIEVPIPSSPIPDWLRLHSKSYEFRGNKSIHYTILRDKLHRVARKIRSEMRYEKTGEERFGRILTEVLFKEELYALGVLVQKPQITPTYIRRGPRITLQEATARFRESHQNVMEIDGHLCVEVKRDWTQYEEMLDSILHEYQIDGLQLSSSNSEISNQVLNVLYKFVLPIEPEFKERITRVKEKDYTPSM